MSRRQGGLGVVFVAFLLRSFLCSILSFASIGSIRVALLGTEGICSYFARFWTVLPLIIFGYALWVIAWRLIGFCWLILVRFRRSTLSTSFVIILDCVSRIVRDVF